MNRSEKPPHPDQFLDRSEISGSEEISTNSEIHRRSELAAACRLAYQFKWNRSVLNHVAARSLERPDHFLMNPVGLLWAEIVSSDFVLCDLNGGFSQSGKYFPGPAGLSFHSAIFRANPDISCSFHLHPKECVALASIQSDLAFITQDSLMLYDQIAYHEFEGPADEPQEGEKIAALAQGKLCVMMRNHGVLTIGRSVAEAFYAMQIVIDTCAIQLSAMSTGAPLRRIPQDVCELSAEKFKRRRMKQPFGKSAWDACYRMLERENPVFKN